MTYPHSSPVAKPGLYALSSSPAPGDHSIADRLRPGTMNPIRIPDFSRENSLPISDCKINHKTLIIQILQKMTLPKDPAMLYSIINMKLRDQYPDLTTLCADLDIDQTALTRTLADAGFNYDPAANAFR